MIGKLVAPRESTRPVEAPRMPANDPAGDDPSPADRFPTDVARWPPGCETLLREGLVADCGDALAIIRDARATSGAIAGP
jgi:hypothetical protein